MISFGFIFAVIFIDLVAICLMVLVLLHAFSNNVPGEDGGKAKDWGTKLQNTVLTQIIRLIMAKIQSSLAARYLSALSGKGQPIYGNIN